MLFFDLKDLFIKWKIYKNIYIVNTFKLIYILKDFNYNNNNNNKYYNFIIQFHNFLKKEFFNIKYTRSPIKITLLKEFNNLIEINKNDFFIKK
tara:strand:- start:1154 stop:1432 length:279 start_codon:yes stop_codon:yes gene_type:complete